MIEKTEIVTWSCHRCRARHAIEHATNKRTLECTLCGAEHRVMGHHVDGRPITRLIYPARTDNIKKEAK